MIATTKLELRQTQCQTQTLRLQQRQSLRILQMPAQELERLIRDTLAGNAFLDSYDEADEPDRLRRASAAQQETSQQAVDDCLAATLAPQECLYERLFSQLRCCDVDPAVRELASAVIERLSPDGYLRESLDRLAEELGRTPADLTAALAVVQGLEPRGVGARDLSECLLLQLDPADPQSDLVRTLIRDHLREVAAGRIEALAQLTGTEPAEVRRAIEAIRGLKPRPVGDSSARPAPTVIPEVAAWLDEDGRIQVQCLRTRKLRLRSRRFIQAYLNAARRQGEDFLCLQQEVQQARELVRMMQDREDTLLRTVWAALEHQREFLQGGLEHLRPLQMETVAEKLKCHPSTVGRAVADKWLETPHGLFPLRILFDGAASDACGSAARRSVRARVRRLIEHEDPQRPLSDGQLAERLAAEGISVARRTIAKYREELGILPGQQRSRAKAA